MDEHRSAYTADGKSSGLSEASLLCLSDLGGQAERELMGAERELKKCWLKGQLASRIHHGQRPAQASCLPATLSLGPQARTGIPLSCLDLPPGPCQVRGRCPYWPPLVHTHTSTLPTWKLTSSKRPPPQLQSVSVS